MKKSKMPKIVSNTTPIIFFLKLNKLDILHQMYGQIYIPEAVYNEIEAGKAKDFYQDLSTIEWINIQEIKDKQAVKYFLDLDAGEAESIILATELNANLIILDEKLGRHHAKHADLKVTGTIGVLIKVKSLGLIEKITPLMDELIEEGVWISETLKNSILKKVGEL